MNIGSIFENGSIFSIQGTTQSCTVGYMPHAKFKGVALKHLVRGEQTGGLLSCHLVKVDPFCSLETHCHPDNLEIHQVISGTGECSLADVFTNYAPGMVSVIPQNIPHRVTAEEEPLYILATFSPALL